MPRVRPILIEGLPGSGKSTTAQAVAMAFERAGAEAQWFHELDAEHPIEVSYDGQRYSSVGAARDEAAAAWCAFLAAPRWQRCVPILESSSLQLPVASLLFADVARPQVDDYVDALLHAIAPADPIIIVLDQANLAASVERVCAIRGPRQAAFYLERIAGTPYGRSTGAAGLPGLSQFWAEHRAIGLRALERNAVPHHVVDVGDLDFVGAMRRVGELVGVDCSPLPGPSIEQLAVYVGDYVAERGADTNALRVDVVDGKLALLDFPYFWRDVPAALLAVGGRRFVVQSWPAEVHFECDAAGTLAMVVRMTRRCGKPPYPDGRYIRTEALPAASITSG